jgi:C-terminal processing protease CtpA/Prc
VIQAQSKDEYYLLLRECAARLRDGHTMVLPPKVFSGQFWAPPIEMHMIEGEVVVTRIGKDEAMARTKIKPGFLVKKIAGVPVNKYLEQNVLKYVSASTRHWRETFGLFLMLEGKRDSYIQVTFQNLKDREYTVQLKRDTNIVAGQGFKHSLFDNFPPVSFKALKGGILVIKMATFENPDIVKLFNSKFDSLNLDKIKGIIIDLRTNMGGQDRLAFNLLSRFIDKEVKTSTWKTRLYNPAFASWGKKEEWYIGKPKIVKPSEKRGYMGPLVVLMGSMTQSAAEDFIMPLDTHGRAILVGEPSAGSSGNPLMVKLPGGGLFMICTKQDTYPDGKVFVGKGIQPHIRVENSCEDIMKGYDVVFEKGIEVLKSWKKYKKE